MFIIKIASDIIKVSYQVDLTFIADFVETTNKPHEILKVMVTIEVRSRAFLVILEHAKEIQTH